MEAGAATEYRPTIKELPTSERPRERLQSYGPGALSTAELLAIILRTGMGGHNVLALSSSLLARFHGLGGLAKASLLELCQERGLGLAKACQLKAAMELGRRMLIASPDDRPQVRSPEDAANLILLEMAFLEQEHLRVILLDTKSYVQAINTVYVGNVNTALVRVAEVFREAVRSNAPSLIVAHNHPSGDPTPSPEDVHVTEQIVAAGKLLDIDVLDHLIIGCQRYVSLKERGLGFK
ncbi:MAG TPA: DNA repair protein RadC [Anaerolineae bacterium]|nr:DNA repair protein RadC [Anaerolineae bacterium]HOQ99316.1 DNA repair protein RadC [Anaerolineae bacterium]HPL30482.1 DNA repair protein RadC [Anaerolineae bacterium]